MGAWRRNACLRALAAGLAALLVLMGCTGPSRKVEQESPAPGAGTTPLAKPRGSSDVALEEALRERRSVRAYSGQPLSWEDVGQLLWAAQGITSDQGGRTAPSAGALYPLEVYVTTSEGVFHYVPDGHRIQLVSSSDARQALWRAALSQDSVREAPAVFVIAAVYHRTERKYGERAERYVQLEAGHACQNMLLQAAALDLGAVPVGAFYDVQVQAALGLSSDVQPLYLVPVGHPR